jgi:hypothetical protein
MTGMRRHGWHVGERAWRTWCLDLSRMGATGDEEPQGGGEGARAYRGPAHPLACQGGLAHAVASGVPPERVV